MASGIRKGNSQNITVVFFKLKSSLISYFSLEELVKSNSSLAEQLTAFINAYQVIVMLMIYLNYEFQSSKKALCKHGSSTINLLIQAFAYFRLPVHGMTIHRCRRKASTVITGE